jgi:uncharacterized protein YjbI with pentapeptide repeats
MTANLREANLKGANLQGADLTEADLQETDLGDANLQGTQLFQADLQSAYLVGANLDGVRNLTQARLDKANGDDRTKLPDGLTRPAHWSKAERSEGQPAQPDAPGNAPEAGGAPGSDK